MKLPVRHAAAIAALLLLPAAALAAGSTINYEVTGSEAGAGAIPVKGTNSGSGGANAGLLSASEMTDGGGGVVVGSATGGAKGAGTINMVGCFVQGTACASIPQGPGYVAGDWYMPYADGSFGGATSNVMVSGTSYCVPGVIADKLTIEGLAVTINTASAGGNLQLAVYTNGTWNRPDTLVINTASISTTSTGPVSATVSNTQVNAGVYWFCTQVDNATVKVVGRNPGLWTTRMIGSATLANAMPGANSLMLFSGISTTGTFGTWPAFTSGTTWTDLTTGINPGATAFQVVSVP